MNIKEAAKGAKQHIAELFTEEGVKDVGLEEIEFDGNSGIWRITIGFSRPWDRVDESPSYSSIAELVGATRKRAREMKVVTLDDAEGKVLSVKNRA